MSIAIIIVTIIIEIVLIKRHISEARRIHQMKRRINKRFI